MDSSELFENEKGLKTDEEQGETLSNEESDQLYQSFSPFDLSEILSREAEMIERHYGNRGWSFWDSEQKNPFRRKQYIKKRIRE